MKIHVYDTHVQTTTGTYYHFDVLVSDATQSRAAEYAQQYLHSIGIAPNAVDQQRCDFCHSEMANPEVKKAIEANGFYILPMEGCPPV